MRSLRDHPAIRRLNAPTRAAATRRRRLRKGLAAGLTAAAVAIAFAPSPGAGSDSQRAHSSSASNTALAGRHLLSLPADAALVSALTDQSRVDVWDRRGHALVREAPVVVPQKGAGGLGTTSSERHVLVGVRPEDMQRIALNRAGNSQDTPIMTMSIDD